MSKTYTLVQRHKSRGIKTWYVRTCTNGRESFKSTGTTNKTEAMKVFTKIVTDANAASNLAIGDIFIKDEAEAFLNSKKGVVSESHTLRCYRFNVLRFLEFCKARNLQTIGDVTPILAQEYIDTFKAKGESAKTIKDKRLIARRVIEYAIKRHGINARNPFELVVVPKIKDRMVEFWTIEELDRIISNAPSKYWAAFWGLMAFAGLRFFEARKLKAGDFKDNFLTIRHGKMDKDSIVPISDKLKALIEPILEENKDKNKRLFIRVVYYDNHKATQVLKKAVLDAGLTIGEGEVHLNHKFRHSFASELLRKGVNITAVQKLGRWSSTSVLFKHYAGVMQKDLVDAVNLL